MMSESPAIADLTIGPLVEYVVPFTMKRKEILALSLGKLATLQYVLIS